MSLCLRSSETIKALHYIQMMLNSRPISSKPLTSKSQLFNNTSTKLSLNCNPSSTIKVKILVHDRETHL